MIRTVSFRRQNIQYTMAQYDITYIIMYCHGANNTCRSNGCCIEKWLAKLPPQRKTSMLANKKALQLLHLISNNANEGEHLLPRLQFRIMLSLAVKKKQHIHTDTIQWRIPKYYTVKGSNKWPGTCRIEWNTTGKLWISSWVNRTLYLKLVQIQAG